MRTTRGLTRNKKTSKGEGLENFSLVNKTRRLAPRVPFFALKEKVLGKDYQLSVALVGNTASRTLNRDYRGKDSSTNVLSFELSEIEGEIILDLAKISTETKKFERTFDNLVAFLFIHGLFHLKGMDHGVTMDSNEAKIRAQFSI